MKYRFDIRDFSFFFVIIVWRSENNISKLLLCPTRGVWPGKNWRVQLLVTNKIGCVHTILDMYNPIPLSTWSGDPFWAHGNYKIAVTSMWKRQKWWTRGVRSCRLPTPHTAQHVKTRRGGQKWSREWQQHIEPPWPDAGPCPVADMIVADGTHAVVQRCTGRVFFNLSLKIQVILYVSFKVRSSPLSTSPVCGKSLLHPPT
jgi:hypothetical protein